MLFKVLEELVSFQLAVGVSGGGGGGDFCSLQVQTCPGVHSVSCKMSAGTFMRAKIAEHRASHPTTS